MTRIPVNIPQFTPNIMNGAGKAVDTENKGEFEKILENQKKTESLPAKKEEEPVDSYEETDQTVKRMENDEVTPVEKNENSAAVKDVNRTEGEAASEEESCEKELPQEVMLQLISMLETASVDVKELLAQELGMTEEELTVLLQNMEITEQDLLNPDVLKEVFLQANELENMAVVLTDESLYSSYRNLEEGFETVMENVCETLDMTEEDVKLLQEQLQQLPKGQQYTTEKQSEFPKVEITEEKASSGREDGLQQSFMAPGQNTYATQNVTEPLNAIPQEVNSYMSTESQNIMNQIMDYMKIQLNGDNTALEMQLQPESLGTLQIRISAKEGIMTAQFTTASETVKAALESQIVQLQQQLESQNLKVDAIEVTVQAHQFESALEQGEERQQNFEEKKNRTRRIDLSNPEEMDGIAEEDRIVAEMMAENGSTVDYLA